MMKECLEYPNVTLIAPPLPISFGTHHTKMFAALYPEKVRVAIFTANFLANDWNNETQGIWFQNFGLKILSDNDKIKKEADFNDFETDLVQYLSSLGARVKDFCRKFHRFDILL
ncbi:putative tyrosyl-DNA phosphodiesterase I [Plasmopara halstedii]